MQVKLLYLTLVIVIFASCAAEKKYSNSKALSGEWISKGRPHLGSIIFSTDSAFYSKLNKSYAYVINNDSISIFFRDKIAKAKLRSLENLIILAFDDGIDTLMKK